ncbi:MAG: ComEC family competence protein [Bacteroidales bacterium]|nr:ComEC family competence protein [Bacteroidales bacterium]HOY37895.1 ComEC/Rec2 family competence protein [Bacteroidales bacterium]HQP03852.1 ComEC/Rec2 family competence protein [Bacteroidales bacterium]
MNFLKQYPFVRLLIPFIAGIILAGYFTIPCIFGIVAITVLLLVLIALYALKEKPPESVFTFTIFLFICLSALTLTGLKSETANDSRLSGYKGQIIGKVSSDPQVSAKTVKLDIALEAVKMVDTWYEGQGSIMVFVPADSAAMLLGVGDKLILSPELKQFENQGNPEEFDYKKYMWYQYIQYTDYIKSDEWKKIEEPPSGSLFVLAANIRNSVTESFRKCGLSGDELAVATALTLGNKSYLSDEIRQSYSVSGGMHVLAVSGLHVGVVYLVISQLLGFIKSKRRQWIKTLLIILLIWGYALITGLSPSVVRAALMFSLFASAGLFRKNANSFNILAAAAFFSLLADPLVLHQIGFQLSYAAVFSILYFYPKIYGLVEVRSRLADKVWSLLSVSVAAQLGTIPFTLFYFNQFPSYFLLTNLIIIPLVTVAIYLAIAIAMFSWIGFLGSALGWVFSKVIFLMNSSVSFIESLPGSVIDGIYISNTQFVILLFLIALVVLFLEFRRSGYLFATLSLIVVFVAIGITKSLHTINQRKIIVYNLRNTTAINIIDGRDNILFLGLDPISEKSRKYTMANYWNTIGAGKEKTICLQDMLAPRLLSNIIQIGNRRVFVKNNFIGFYDTKIYIPGATYAKSPETLNDIAVDLVIITDEASCDVYELSRQLKFDQLVIDASVSDNRRKLLLQQAADIGLSAFDVKNKGAFIIDK